jgi:hypothetical protein
VVDMDGNRPPMPPTGLRTGKESLKKLIPTADALMFLTVSFSAADRPHNQGRKQLNL